MHPVSGRQIPHQSKESAGQDDRLNKFLQLISGRRNVQHQMVNQLESRAMAAMNDALTSHDDERRKIKESSKCVTRHDKEM